MRYAEMSQVDTCTTITAINPTINLMKVISTALVVVVHSGNIFRYANIAIPQYFQPVLCISSTAVPVFFLMSSYLLFSKPFKYENMILKKIKTLLIPYSFWIVFWVLFEIIGFRLAPSAGFENVLTWSVKEWLLALIGIPFTITPICAPLWFVRDLFILCLFSPIILSFVKKVPIIVSFTIVSVLWFAPLNMYFKQPAVFFILGCILSVNIDVKNFFKKISLKISFLSGGVATLIALVWPIYISGQNLGLVGLIAVLLYMVMIYGFCKEAIKIYAVRYLTDYLIQYNFIVYVTHGKCLSMLQILSVKLIIQTPALLVVESFVFTVVLYLACIVFGNKFKKWLPKLFILATRGSMKK